MSQGSMETKIIHLESKLVNIESKLDEVLKHLKRGNQITKKVITKKSPLKESKKSATPTSDTIVLTEYSDNIILVTGDTYDCRHLLKPHRAKWEPEKKGWLIYKKNIRSYSQFKNTLETNCRKLNIHSKTSPFHSNSSIKSNVANASIKNVCEIESSSDED